MKQINIDALDAIVNELAAGKKISEALSTVYTKRNVAIRFNADDTIINIRDLHLSGRVTNALIRTRLKTLGDVFAYIETEKITRIQNFGRTSCIELCETILDYCFDHMSMKEKEEFLIDTVIRNECYLKI